MSTDWINLFSNQHVNALEPYVQFINATSYKIGKNIPHNRFLILNGKILQEWLNETPVAFKVSVVRLLRKGERVLLL